MRSLALLALSALALAACADVRVQPAGDGRYTVESDYNMWNPRYGVADYARRRALEACPGGYRTVSERDLPRPDGAGGGTFALDIECNH